METHPTTASSLLLVDTGLNTADDIVEDDDNNNNNANDDEDSFEDMDNIPRFTFLYEYIESKVVNGVFVVNANGYSEAKKTASVEEIGIYYCTHPAFIREKRAKYEAYNARLRRTLCKDYIYSAANEKHYTFIGRPVERYIRQHEAEYIDPIASHRKHGSLWLASSKAAQKESKEERAARINEAIHTRTLRIEDVNTEKELYDYFAYHIRHQRHATRAIAHAIFSMKSNITHEGDSEQNANIRSILASGVSGTGKSAIIKLMLPLFRMEPGAVNEDCYAELRFGNVSDSSHRNAINGTGAGFEGMHEDCLVDHLEKARIAIEARGPSHSQQPNIILVFIDEICKPATEVRVLDSLNSLFAEGVLMRASGNVTFRLPNNVKMLFYSTANYGEARIVNYDARRDYSRALEAIRYDMKRKKVRDCDISRIGEIVPFFAMQPEQARQIMKFNLDCYFNAKVPRSFTMSEEDRVRFVDFYFDGNYTAAHGMRMPNKKLKQELEHIRTLQLQPGITTRAITTTPSLHFDIITYTGFDHPIEELCHQYPILIKAMACDEMNGENLLECIDAHANIGYASLCHQGEPYFIYVARPQSYHPGEDDDDYENDAEEETFVPCNKNSNIDTRLIELVTSDRYRDNPLAHAIFNIIGETTHVNKKRAATNPVVTEHVNKKKRCVTPTLRQNITNDEEEANEYVAHDNWFDIQHPVIYGDDNNNNNEEEEEEENSALEPNQAENKRCPDCGSYKPIGQFIKKYTYKGAPKSTICDTCGTCRRKRTQARRNNK